jgi:hypothetical protein
MFRVEYREMLQAYLVAAVGRRLAKLYRRYFGTSQLSNHRRT